MSSVKLLDPNPSFSQDCFQVYAWNIWYLDLISTIAWFCGSWRSNKLLHDVVGPEILKMIWNQQEELRFPRSAAATRYLVRPTEKLLVLLWPRSPWWLRMSLCPRDLPVSWEWILGYPKWCSSYFVSFQLCQKQPRVPRPSLNCTRQPFCKHPSLKRNVKLKISLKRIQH